MNSESEVANRVALPVIDVDVLGRLARAGGQGNEPLQLLARLAADADSSGLVHDFSLSALARRCGYGPSGRRTLAGYLRPLIAAGAVDYRPARGPAPGHCTLRLAPPPGTRVLIRAPQTRRADFCSSDQHVSGPTLKDLKEVKETPPLPPHTHGQHTSPARQVLGRGDEQQTPPSTALVDALVQALPPRVKDLPRLAKDGGGWHCLAVTTAELAALIGDAATIAAVTANPPADLRSPVAWLLARARQLRDQATARQPAKDSHPVTAPTPSGVPPSPQAERPATAATPRPVAPAPTAGDHVGESCKPHEHRSAPLSPVPTSPGVSDALAAAAALTVAGPWQEQLLAAAAGQLMPTNSTVRSLALAVDEALTAAPHLGGRALIISITTRIMPSAVKDLPALLAARARAYTAATNHPHAATGRLRDSANDRRCGTCEGSQMVLDDADMGRPCPTCRPDATVRSTPPRQPPSHGGFARIGDLLPHRSVLAPNPRQEDI